MAIAQQGWRANTGGGAGATPPLADVLAVGFTTGANDISIDSGQGILFNDSGFTNTISAGTFSANRAITWPDKSGVVALVTDIPADQGLPSVLGIDFTTGANDISIDSGQSIIYNNGGFTATISEGTFTANRVITWPDKSGVVALVSDIPSVAITDDVLPRGTGSGIEDGTWSNVGNDIIPLTDGSNIGNATEGVGTLFMASTIDYRTDLTFVNSATTRMTLSTAGDLGIGGTSPATHRLFVKGVASTPTTTAAFEAVNSSDESMLLVRNDGVLLFNGGGQGGNMRFQGTDTTYVAGNNFYLMQIDPDLGGIAMGSPRSTSGWPNARLQITGSGTTSATSALTIFNAGLSNADQMVQFRNDGIVIFNVDGLTNGDFITRNSSALTLFRTDASTDRVAIGLDVPLAKLHIVTDDALSSTKALFIENSVGLDLLDVRNNGEVYASGWRMTGTELLPVDLTSKANSANTHDIASSGFPAKTIYSREFNGGLGRNVNFGFGFSNNDRWTSANGSGGGAQFTASTGTNRFKISNQNQTTEGIVLIGDGFADGDFAAISAAIELRSVSHGFLYNRTTTGERDAISTPAHSLFVYNTDQTRLNYYNSSLTAWTVIDNQDRKVITTATYTALSTDRTLGVTRTATGTCVITLPPAADFPEGTGITVKDEAGNATNFSITLDGDTAETIDGELTQLINADYDSLTIYSDGSGAWFIK